MTAPTPHTPPDASSAPDARLIAALQALRHGEPPVPPLVSARILAHARAQAAARPAPRWQRVLGRWGLQGQAGPALAATVVVGVLVGLVALQRPGPAPEADDTVVALETAPAATTVPVAADAPGVARAVSSDRVTAAPAPDRAPVARAVPSASSTVTAAAAVPAPARAKASVEPASDVVVVSAAPIVPPAATAAAESAASPVPAAAPGPVAALAVPATAAPPVLTPAPVAPAPPPATSVAATPTLSVASVAPAPPPHSYSLSSPSRPMPAATARLQAQPVDPLQSFADAATGEALRGWLRQLGEQTRGSWRMGPSDAAKSSLLPSAAPAPGGPAVVELTLSDGQGRATLRLRADGVSLCRAADVNCWLAPLSPEQREVAVERVKAMQR